MRDVVLAPGLWMPGAAMALLAARLSRNGYSTQVFSYPGRGALEENVSRLRRFAAERLHGRPAHFVGHSLGGVLILHMLNRYPEIPAASAVLLGSPVRGCEAGRRFARNRLGAWWLGHSRDLWNAHESRWERDVPLGVVAGTGALGLGRLVGRLPGENDSVVCVDETTVEGMRERALVPCAHSWLIASPAVAELVERFFAKASFR